MKQYLDMLRYVLENGVDKMDRTGVGTRSVFGQQMRFDLSRGFPLMTTKKMHLKALFTSFCGLSKEIQTLSICRITACESGTNGQMKTVIWDRFTVRSGETGTARELISWHRWLTSLRTIPTTAE